MSMLHLSKAGNSLEEVMEISHVIVTASKINPSSRLLGAIETHVHDLVHLQPGIDVVMLLHLVVAIALCMANMVEMHVATIVVATDARTEAEEEMDIANEAQIAIVGALVLVAPAMRMGCPHLVPRW